MNYRLLSFSDISDDMLLSFNHRQAWNKQWVKQDSVWVLLDACKVREWSHEKRQWIAEYLREQIERGGSVFGAFDGNHLVGFCSIDGVLSGSNKQYANLTMLFVDDKYQGMGIGKSIIFSILREAKRLGASKLFVSAIPSERTIAFYMAMSFCDAKEVIPEFIDSDEDRLLECDICC